MIPYEELVIALQTWRAKQGLPVGQLSGALTPPPMVVAPPPLRAGPPVKPPKMGSTGPQQAFLGNVATPPPLAAPEDSLDVDDASLIEEAHYESEGDDFAMNFAGFSSRSFLHELQQSLISRPATTTSLGVPIEPSFSSLTGHAVSV